MLYVTYPTLRSWEHLQPGELSSGTAGKGDSYLEMTSKKPQTPKFRFSERYEESTVSCAWLLLI